MGMVVKLCVVGPMQSGKSLLCKLLAQQPLGNEVFDPTSGVRIQQLERFVGGERLTVHLWDCSGDLQYQNSWQTLSRGLSGVIFVSGFELGEESSNTMDRFFSSFVTASDLNAEECFVVCLNGDEVSGRKIQNMSRVSVKFTGQNDQDILATIMPEMDRLLRAALDRGQRETEQNIADAY